jgi:TPR repeat protein
MHPNATSRAGMVFASLLGLAVSRVSAADTDPALTCRLSADSETISGDIVRACKAALARTPDAPDIEYVLGRALAEGGQPAEGLPMLTAAATADLRQAQFYLGAMYLTGDGVPRNGTKAVYWLEQASRQGSALASDNLGLMYYNGDGVSRDYSRALTYFNAAAALGDASGENMLAVLYSQGLGVAKDMDKAVSLYTKAADQGLASAEENLGDLFLAGDGVRRDPSKAATLLADASRQGLASASTTLGEMYAAGSGVPKSPKKAYDLVKPAADTGDARAEMDLAVLYLGGDAVPRDLNKSSDLMRMAANQGYADAQFKLGLMTLHGWGVPLSQENAIAWLEKAAGGGSKEAEPSLAALKAVPLRSDGRYDYSGMTAGQKALLGLGALAVLGMFFDNSDTAGDGGGATTKSYSDQLRDEWNDRQMRQSQSDFACTIGGGNPNWAGGCD